MPSATSFALNAFWLAGVVLTTLGFDILAFAIAAVGAVAAITTANKRALLYI
jgi:hypothetical protein